MTIKEFLQLLRRNWLLLLVIPLATAVSVFFFSREEAKEYTANTTIYTGIASNFSIDKSSAGGDYANNKAYSNLLSLITARSTKQEVALRLLARDLSLAHYDPAVLNQETYTSLKKYIDEPLRQQLVGSSLAETTSRLTSYLQRDNKNVIYKILNSDIPNYSFVALDKITASQISNSDLVKVGYVSTDALLCQQTLVDLTDVFIRKHRELQEGQNGSVVGYFSDATSRARRRLDAAEKDLLAFQRTNNLINYDEQAQNIATQKDGFEQQLNELELQYAGAISTQKALDKNLKSQGIANVGGQEIYHLNNQLVDLHTQIANAEVFGKTKVGTRATSNSSTQALKEQAEQVEHRMQQGINKYTASAQSGQGVTTKNLAAEWLDATILVDELKAKLLVMRRQRDDFSQEYQKVAPLGAEIRKIERERELAEKEYLAVLNNLDQSRVAQQNIALTSRLKVVDSPYLLANRASSKRLLLILFSAFTTLLLTVGGLSGAALLDQSLRNPVAASTKTSLPVLGLLPEQLNTSREQQELYKKAEHQLTRQFLLQMQQKQGAQRPYVAGIMSSHTGEGKSTVATSLAVKLSALGVKTLLLLPKAHAQPLASTTPTAFYAPLEGLNPSVTLGDVAGEHLANFAVVVIEFPALLEATYPVALLQHLDLILVAVKASRTWQAADRNLFAEIQKVAKAPIELVLNSVTAIAAEDYLGTQAAPVAQEQPAVSVAHEPQWQGKAVLHS